MSCQIKLTANIQDVPAIRRCLFPTDDQRGSDSWLQFCEISPSPTGDIIAIARERRIVVLTSKWDSSSGLSQFHIGYSGSIHEYDKVKAVLCLPIVGETQSSHVGPDWTCICVGFDSGFVRFYTENCELLLEEQLHAENISNIKCRSLHNPRPDISSDLHPEELYVQYQSIVAVLSGNKLFSSLRACRSQLARVQAKSDSIMNISQLSLNPRKWGFQDQAVINDSAVAGLNMCSVFDHLLTASTCGGFESKYRAMPPQSTLVLASGSKPFLGYHYALEGCPQPVFSDVAKAVASSLKSALPGWLMGGAKAQVEKHMSVALQPAESMGCRFGLCDLRRTASDLILSPDHKLCAVSDCLGRVLLIDTFKGIVLRIFKGYRDAQCSFLLIPDERHSKHKPGDRVALFLVIYAPKKGTLEIFTVQQGAKVATFTASKCSRLLYVNYGLVGFNFTSKSRYICTFTTVFIDADGQVKEILIPFHFALSEKNNKRARDIHLYKKLRQLVKSGEFNVEQLSEMVQHTCKELKTLEMKQQTVEMLLHNKGVPVEVTLECLEYFSEVLDEKSSEDSLRTLVKNAGDLLRFYSYVNSTNTPSEQLETNSNSQEEDIPPVVSDIWTKEMTKLDRFAALCADMDKQKFCTPEKTVKFAESTTFTFTDLFSVFNTNNPENISVKSKVDEATLFQVSECLFKRHVTGNGQDSKRLQEEISNSRIVVKDLLLLLVHYWVYRPASFDIHLSLRKEMNNLSGLIYEIVQCALLTDQEDVVVAEDRYSNFWSSIRDYLTGCSRPFPAMVAALLCKYIQSKVEQEQKVNSSNEDGSYEFMTLESCAWEVLIEKLDYMSLLTIILSGKPLTTDCPLPKLNQEKTDVSLRYILRKGRGIVSELVARWLSSAGVNPENIVLHELQLKLDNDSENDLLKEAVMKYPEPQLASVKAERLYWHLGELAQEFPFSLVSSAILTNMTWEYALAWQKSIENLELLEAAIKCLNCIPAEDGRVKQGVYNLLWNTHLRILFENVCKLINKVGKLPKERLCKQDTGLSDYQVTKFTEICAEFLGDFVDVVDQTASIPDQKPLQFEPIWDNYTSNGGAKDQVALVELAVSQRGLNLGLLLVHHQLSQILQMITTFGIKHSKPINNLFDTTTIEVFFTDFQRVDEVNWTGIETKITSSRTQFLLKIISASLDLVVQDEGTWQLYSMEHVRWMSKCLMLARYWQLDLDVLRRFQVVQLFVHGFDSIGEELVPAVNDTNKLGGELFVVAAKRLAQFMASSPKLSHNITALSPALTNYLDKLDGEWCAPSQLSDIRNLASHSVRCLSEDQPNYRLAHLLLEACFTLEEIQSQ